MNPTLPQTRIILFFSFFITFVFIFTTQAYAGTTYTKGYYSAPPAFTTTAPTCEDDRGCDNTSICWNSERTGATDCGDRCSDGDPWTKYSKFGCFQTYKDYFTLDEVCQTVFVESGDTCSTADKYNTGNPPVMNAGFCNCTVGGAYKTCCSGTTQVNANFYPVDPYSPDEADCGGYTTVRCGAGGQPACGQAACNTLAPPPPPPPPVCVPDGSCNAPTPACGTTTSGVDNCGNPCTKQGSACTPPSQTCVPGSPGPVCDGGYCTDGTVCAQGHQYCLSDGSGYGSCSIEVDNCTSQCSAPPPPVQTCVPFSQGPVCNGGQCTDGTVCAQGHQYCLWDGSDYGECSIEVDNCSGQCTGSTLPNPCGNGVCSSDETCTTCSQDCGACQTIEEPPKAIPNLVCKESVSTNGGNTWSNSVSAQPGQTVQFKMEITNLGSPIDWLAVRNDFDEAIDGFTNLWQNTQPNVPWNIYADQPDELGYPGIYVDSHYEDYGGFGNGAVDTTPWSATLNAGARTFKNYGYGVYGGYAQPWQFNGNFNDRCWSNPDAGSGSTTCLQIVPAPDGGRCNPAWQWCPYNMYAFCNSATVSTNSVPPPNITLNNTSCTPANTDNLVTISWETSSPAVTWADISTNSNFQGYYNKSVSGTTQTNASVGFNGSPSSGLNGALKFQPGQRYYVRLWNGVRHSDTISFDTPAACSPTGNLDTVDCNNFTGWTCDGDDYNNQLQVDFWTKDASGGNAYVGWARANGEREAAVGSACGGNPSHGFTYPTPASLKDGTDHEIYAYGLNLTNTPGTHTLLNGSPKILNCAPIPTSNDRSGPPTTCNGNVAYTGNEASYGQWNNQCNGRIQQAGSNGIGQTCCEQACGADAGCDEEAPNQGNCNAQCGIISSDANRPWIKTTGGDVHSNTGINTPGGP